MKLVYAGTPEFAARALSALIAAGHEVVQVLTQPDRPSGRGMKLTASPVKQVALAHGIPVAQPLSLKTPEAQAELADVFRETSAAVMVVAAYGLILPQAVLDMPRLGCVNIHASLLPRWRGAAPIQRAIEAGDAETGITLMRMEAGLDTGPMLRRLPLPILPDDTCASLHDRLAELGAAAIVDVLPGLAQCTAEPQDAALATYAAKISKVDARIDWRLPAAVIARRIRAFNPAPGAWTEWQGQPLKIWRVEGVEGVEGSTLPGTLHLMDESLRVACGEGALQILELQAAGSKRMTVAAFLAGRAIAPGTVWS